MDVNSSNISVAFETVSAWTLQKVFAFDTLDQIKKKEDDKKKKK